MYLFDNNTESGLWKIDSGYMAFATTNTERMRISSEGTMGFNSSIISSRSYSFKAIGGSPIVIEAIESAGVHSMFFRPNNSGYNLISSNYLSGGTYLPLSLSARENNGDFILTNSGTAYINSSTNPLPDNATPQFGVLAGANTDAVNIKHTQNGNNTFNLWQTGTTSCNMIAFYKGDTQTNRGLITVTTSGTTYNSVSDYRLKENIVPLENGLDRVLQLKPSKFNWIETGDETEGFIAHELQEYFPDAVTGEKDAVYSSTGNIKPQSVDYGRITPLLVKAIQELEARVKELENK